MKCAAAAATIRKMICEFIWAGQSAEGEDRSKYAGPSGQVDTLTDVAANQFIVVKEGAGIVRTPTDAERKTD